MMFFPEDTSGTEEDCSDNLGIAFQWNIYGIFRAMSSDQKDTVILHLFANLLRTYKNTKLGRAVIPLDKYMIGKYYK